MRGLLPSGLFFRESCASRYRGWKAQRRLTFALSHSRSDDDTFFPDFEATVRMLAEQGSSTKPSLVGALSESTKQVNAASSGLLIPSSASALL